MPTKTSTETVRFRLWVSDTACYEGEAGVTTYTGSHTTDEFGMYDGDDYDADLDILYFCEEGEAPKEMSLKEIYQNAPLHRQLRNAAVEALDYPPCLEVVFPGEQSPAILKHLPAPYQIAA